LLPETLCIGQVHPKDPTRLHTAYIATLLYFSTRSSAAAEGPRDALC